MDSTSNKLSDSDSDSDDETMSELEAGNLDDGNASQSTPAMPLNTENSRLTLAAIKEQLDSVCFKKENCPPGLVGNPENVDAFVKALVIYANEVHPAFWKYLFEPQNQPGNAVVDIEVLNLGRSSANRKEDNEHPIKSVNWQRVLLLSKQTGYSTSRQAKDEAKSFSTHMTKKKKNDFGKIVSGVLVKLLDAKFSHDRPSKNLRVKLLGDDSQLLERYSELKDQNVQSEDSKWVRKICLPDKFTVQFPNSLNESNLHDVTAFLECMTDDEGELEFESCVAQTTDCRSVVFKQNQKLSMTTEEQIAHAKRELANEQKRESDYQMAAVQCRAKCDGWEKRIEELETLHQVEMTNNSVVRTISTSLGQEEYLKHGSRVPLVFLTVFEEFNKSGLSWECYWTRLQANLRVPSMAATVSEHGTASPQPPGNLIGEAFKDTVLNISTECQAAASVEDISSGMTLQPGMNDPVSMEYDKNIVVEGRIQTAADSMSTFVATGETQDDPFLHSSLEVGSSVEVRTDTTSGFECNDSAGPVAIPERENVDEFVSIEIGSSASFREPTGVKSALDSTMHFRTKPSAVRVPGLRQRSSPRKAVVASDESASSSKAPKPKARIKSTSTSNPSLIEDSDDVGKSGSNRLGKGKTPKSTNEQTSGPPSKKNRTQRKNSDSSIESVEDSSDDGDEALKEILKTLNSKTKIPSKPKSK